MIRYAQQVYPGRVRLWQLLPALWLIASCRSSLSGNESLPGAAKPGTDAVDSTVGDDDTGDTGTDTDGTGGDDAADGGGTDSSAGDPEAKDFVTSLHLAADAANGPAAANDDDTEIFFTWVNAADNPPLKQMDLVWFAQANCAGTSTTIADVSGTSKTHTGTDGDTYSFRLKVVPRTGKTLTTACSNNLIVDTSDPEIPTLLKINAESTTDPHDLYDDDTQIYLSWKPSGDTGVGLRDYSVTVYRQALCAGPEVPHASGLVVETTPFTGILGETYSFKVTAFDLLGHSTISNCSPALTMGSMTAASALKITDTNPTDPHATYDDDTTIYFSWAAGIDSGSGIRDYTVTWYALSACIGAGTDIAAIAGTDQMFVGTNGTTYSFRVTTFNNATDSAPSVCSAPLTIDTSNPVAATGLKIPADAAGAAHALYDNDANIFFAWTAGSDSGSGVRDYTLKRYAQTACGGAATDTTGLTATSQAFAGVNGTTYSFEVVTFDNAGNSTTSACSADMTIDTSAPTGASVLKIPADAAGDAHASFDDDTGVFFAWTAGSDVGGTGIRDYTVRRYAQAACAGGFTDVTGVASTSQAFTGTNGTTYSFTVITYDNAGNSVTSACSASLTIDTTVPTGASALKIPADAAGGVHANYDDDVNIFFAWTAGSAGGSGIRDYTVRRYTQAACGGGFTDMTGITGTSQAFAGANGTTYSFEVITYNNLNASVTSSCSSSLTIDTTTPTGASVLKIPADAAGDAHANFDNDLNIFFAWTAGSDAGGSGIRDYTVRRYALSTCGGGFTDMTGITGTSQAFTGVSGTTYSFRVITYDNAGNSVTSGCSADSTIDTTAPPTASGLKIPADAAPTAHANFDDDINIFFAWTDVTDTSESAFRDYTIRRYTQAACAGGFTDVTGIGGNSQAFAGTDGTTYSFRVLAYDNAGNSSTSACSASLTIDTMAPGAAGALKITDGAAGVHTLYDDDTSSTFHWVNGADLGSGWRDVTIRYYTQAACAGGFTDVTGLTGNTRSHTGVAGTTYSFEVITYDNAGNSTTSACSSSMTIDTTVPTGATALKIPADAAGGVHANYDDDVNIFFAWTAGSDAGVGIRDYTVRRYDDTGCSITPIDTTGVTATNLAFAGTNGNTYSFRVITYDNAGNSVTSACSSDLVIDTSGPPAASSLKIPADSAGAVHANYDDDTTIYFNWFQTSDSMPGSGVRDMTVRWYSQAACAGGLTDITGLSGSTSITGTNGTTYSFQVLTYDNAGNVTTSACSSSLTIDTTVPGGAVSRKIAPDAVGDAHASYDNDTAVYFVWSGFTDGGSGIRDYTLRRYTQAACAGGSTDTTGITATDVSFTGTNGTTYSFSVTAYDNAGNSTSSACSSSLMIDTTNPTGATTPGPTADAAGGGFATTDDDVNIFFNWTAGSDAGSGVRDYTVRWYSQAACAGGATSITGITAVNQSFAGVDGTTYSFDVITYDNAGNSVTSTCSPAITITVGGGGPLARQQPLINILYTTTNTVTLHYAYGNSAGSMTDEIASAAGHGSQSGMALDANNKPYILSYDPVNFAPSIGNRTSGSWSTISPFSSSAGYIRGGNSSLAHGSNGYLHAVFNHYLDDANPDHAPVYSYFDGTWHETSLASLVGAGKWLHNSDIALDANNKVHIALTLGTNGLGGNDEVMYLENTSGSFVNSTGGMIPVSCVIGQYPTSLEMAFDRDGDLHAVYGCPDSAGDCQLNYAVRSGGSWSRSVIATVDETFNACTGTGFDMDLNPQGLPRVVYVPNGAEPIVYSYNGAAWSSETVTTGVSISSPKISVDYADKIYLAYIESNDVKLAVKNGTWSISTVYSGPQAIGWVNDIQTKWNPKGSNHPLRTFVTSTTYDGDTADNPTNCNTRAAAGGLWGNYDPILSKTGNPAISTLSLGILPIHNLNDEVVSTSGMLWSGNLSSPFNYTELGGSPSVMVWTGTTDFGTLAGSNCLDWTSNGAGQSGEMGDPAITNLEWATQNTQSCNVLSHIYCISQP